MKFPYSMLLEFVRTELGAEQVGELLTMAGFEVEGIEEVEGEPVIDVKVMSNRGDALSVYGLSREVLAKDQRAAATALYRRASARFADSPDGSIHLSPDIAAIESEECNRFACRAFENVPGSAEAPIWIQDRLRRVGMRPISLLVDLTNYVMLELGQPLHAFDRDKLRQGRIVVRYARPGERLTTLNGQEHELNGQMMICDGERPVGVPGVMGGLETEVMASTERLLLESANFRNSTVRRTRKQLGLNTEASYRFERSVDPDGVVAAIRRFTELLAQSVPQARFSNVVDHYPRPPATQSIRLRIDRASRLLGMPISPAEAAKYLTGLGFETSDSTADELEVKVPSWRPDVVREEDLVEELGRVHGYEKIPERLPAGRTTLGGARGEYFVYDCLREAVVRAGFVQIVSHSLRDLHPLDLQKDPASRLGPRVVASPEYAYLRDSLLPSLSDAAQRNGGRNLHLFEVGKIFDVARLVPGDGYRERRSLAMLSTGELLPNDRRNVTIPVADFYSLKGALQGIFAAVRLQFDLVVDEAPDRRFHPTRQAKIRSTDVEGVIGQIHPDIAEALNLPAATILAEVQLDRLSLFERSSLGYRHISRNPSVRRDIAVLIGKEIEYSTVADLIAAACGEVLERQWLFDVFEGAGIPEGSHSLGIALQLRKFGENFTDEEANRVRDLAVAALVDVGATTR